MQSSDFTRDSDSKVTLEVERRPQMCCDDVVGEGFINELRLRS